MLKEPVLVCEDSSFHSWKQFNTSKNDIVRSK